MWYCWDIGETKKVIYKYYILFIVYVLQLCITALIQQEANDLAVGSWFLPIAMCLCTTVTHMYDTFCSGGVDENPNNLLQISLILESSYIIALMYNYTSDQLCGPRCWKDQ